MPLKYAPLLCVCCGCSKEYVERYPHVTQHVAGGKFGRVRSYLQRKTSVVSGRSRNRMPYRIWKYEVESVRGTEPQMHLEWSTRRVGPPRSKVIRRWRTQAPQSSTGGR